MTRSPATEARFYRLIAAVESVALRVRVEDSAIVNANDAAVENRWAHGGAEYWDCAVSTAQMILDCPRDYYPEIV